MLKTYSRRAAPPAAALALCAALVLCAPALAAAAGDTSPPTPPTDLAVSFSSGTATLTWKASTDDVGVAGYDILVGGQVVATTKRKTFSTGNLTCATTYFVGVAAFDAAGNTSQPAALTVTTPACGGGGGTPPPPPPPPPPTPPPTSVAAPQPPSSYTVPSGAKLVSTAAQLTTALGQPAQDIVLADGTYDSSQPFLDSNGSHIYAQHLGRAVLTAGLVIGGNFGRPGGLVRGVTFDVTSQAKTLRNAELELWGNPATDAQVLDCTFDGNWSIGLGVEDIQPQGLVVQRVALSHFTDGGLRLTNNSQVAYGASTPKIQLVSDVSVDGVSRATPGSSKGTAESGVWIGHPVVDGVHRIRIRNVSWSGIETTNDAWDTTFTDLDIDMSGPWSSLGVAFYMEHFSRHLVIDGFQITGSDVGIKAEWNDPAWGGVAAAHDTTIRNGTIDSTGWNRPGNTVGLFLDQGTDSTTVTGVTFKNMNFAAIDAFNVVGTNSFTGNSYSLPSGVPQISTQHM